MLQQSFESIQQENNTIKKTALIMELGNINPKLVELHKESSVEALQTAIITAKAMTGDFPPHDSGAPPEEEETEGIIIGSSIGVDTKNWK